ncbi:MAG TPA: DUF1648 domain-containing protein [Galbitalea sp.]|nr:DUF1648 domain-containing protein [Galbitalea sp.]
MTSALHGFRMLSVAILAPLVITIAGVLVSLALAANAPARIATHWDSAGHIDGYGSPYTYAIVIATVCVPLIVLLGGSAVLVSHRSPVTVMIKVLGVSTLWVSVLIAVGLTGALLDQPTAASVASATAPGLSLLAGAVIASLLSVGAWFVMPRAVRSPSDSELTSVAPVLLADGERASWIRTASASREFVWVFAGIGVLLGAAEVLVVVTTAGAFWWFTFIPVVALVILLSNLAWTVRVDARGVKIRSVLGVPSITIPLDNVERAVVVDIRAFSQYGGWGVRFNLAGRIGIILRSGQALEIHRKRGLIVVITVDDATTAAALINGLVQRQVTGV